MSEPLLLHSLSEFRELIFPVLEIAGVDSIVEVGSESGGFTMALAEWSAQRNGHHVCVEPFPADDVRALPERFEGFDLREARSPEVLNEIEPADAYLLDGDHNYHVVSGELRTIAERTDGQALVVLHDVGWPCGRRDFYYAPDELPAAGVHPHSYELGVLVGESGLVTGGFRGAGQAAFADHEGGPRNGVLTAVEDHVAEHDGLRYLHVPSLFGLGFLFPADAPFAPAVQAQLAPYTSGFMERLERNRLSLYLHVIAMQDEARDRAARQSRLLLDYERRLGAAAAAAATRGEALHAVEHSD